METLIQFLVGLGQHFEDMLLYAGWFLFFFGLGGFIKFISKDY